MPDPDRVQRSLRERKQQRVRDAIVEAAHALFGERGFDHVTVTDIADRAEVGRSTFFRYFGDKQEVAFAGSGVLEEVMATADEIPVEAPIGDSLPKALNYVRAAVVSFVEALTEQPAGYALHEELVARHPELHARRLMKQRSYAGALTELLMRQGAGRETATLAAELGLACYYAGQSAGGNDPARLVAAVDAAFARICP
ncbi:MAG: TetR family transcriptional regulator [Pseudonocardiaceae bacterium]|nr:TetR family transcriptional regulator [Pseudonocardiaceae bacterium]